MWDVEASFTCFFYTSGHDEHLIVAARSHLDILSGHFAAGEQQARLLSRCKLVSINIWDAVRPRGGGRRVENSVGVGRSAASRRRPHSLAHGPFLLSLQPLLPLSHPLLTLPSSFRSEGVFRRSSPTSMSLTKSHLQSPFLSCKVIYLQVLGIGT